MKNRKKRNATFQKNELDEGGAAAAQLQQRELKKKKNEFVLSV